MRTARIMKSVSLCFALLLAISARAEERLVMVRVEQPVSAWNDSKIYQKLATSLTRDGNLQVVPATPARNVDPAFPTDALDEQAIADWARPYQAQYVVVVIVQSERLEKRKSFHVPLLFHKFETWGVIEGELRLIDVARNKQVRAVPFMVEQVGPRAWQATMDDDINDPDLRMTAPDKVQFFSRLEDKLVTNLLDQIRGPLGRNDREYVSQPQAKK